MPKLQDKKAGRFQKAKHCKNICSNCEIDIEIAKGLCSKCNTAIGMMQDDVCRLHSAISYINNY